MNRYHKPGIKKDVYVEINGWAYSGDDDLGHLVLKSGKPACGSAIGVGPVQDLCPGKPCDTCWDWLSRLAS